MYPVCNRARVVSYDRPYAAENGSGNFLGLEYPLVRWAEQHGLDVTYASPTTSLRPPLRRLDLDELDAGELAEGPPVGGVVTQVHHLVMRAAVG